MCCESSRKLQFLVRFGARSTGLRRCARRISRHQIAAYLGATAQRWVLRRAVMTGLPEALITSMSLSAMKKVRAKGLKKKIAAQKAQ
jgi:hypothetical protein